MSYELLEHTADAKFEATGESIEDAFSSAVDAFSEIVGGEGGQHRHKISIESESHEALLFDFLDELIWLQDVEDVVISHAKSIEIEETDKGYKLEAVLWTNPITGDMTPTDVKGPTYSEMEMTYEKGTGWKIVAVLDM
mgnify:CR=1 FL=1